MAFSETITIEVGYEDDGTIIFADIDKEQIPYVRKALAYLYKQEQAEKEKARANAPTCRNCKFSLPRDCKGLCCSKQIVNKYYKKVVRPTQTCEMFERKED